MLLFLRSLLFTIIMMVTVCLFALAVCLFYFARFEFRLAIARAWSRQTFWWLRVLCKLDYKVEGREHIPTDRPVVCYMKHQSAWETLAQMIEFPTQSWVCKHELLYIPIFGWALAAMRPIAIDRGAGHNAVNQVVSKGKVKLADGHWVMIFPEGTRMAPGTTRRYGISGAILSRESGAPILPVALNAGDFWRRNGILKRPGTITMRIGPPIEPAGRDPQAINAEAQAWIEAQMKELSPGYAGIVLEKKRR
jgi:1-acyl-sn-glycerol-3-phosphate acyltransferase